MAKIIDKTPDGEKAKSLKNLAEKILERIDETDKEKYATQVVRDYYNVIHNLLEAISTSIGKKVKGKGAHAELISLICEKFEIERSQEQFLQNLRKYRNRISYEGLFVRKDYLERNEKNIREIIESLKEILDSALPKE